MTLLLSNDDVAQVLTMKESIEVVEEAFRELGEGRAIYVDRTDMLMPSGTTEGTYYLKTIQGAVTKFDAFAIRINSDVWSYPVINGKERMFRLPIPVGAEKRFCALVLLYRISTCEPLAILHSGLLQRMRVGATGGLGVKYLARTDATTVGLIGSGWQAGAQLMAMKEVRNISWVKVYSTRKEKREAFALEMSKLLDLDVVPVDSPRECVKNVDIVNMATSSRQPVIDGSWLEPGMHVHCVTPLEIDQEVYFRSDVKVSNARPQRPWVPGVEFPYIDVHAMPDVKSDKANLANVVVPVEWNAIPGLAEVMLGKVPGRTNDEEITLHLNNVGLGIQFAAVGSKIYQLASERGLGRELPTEWFLQNVEG